MYEAVLIKPEYLKKRGKKTIACTFSGLKYTTEEYEVLFKAKKLAYVEFTSFIHTHPIEGKLLLVALQDFVDAFLIAQNSIFFFG